MAKRQISTAYSTGKFELAFPFLSKNVKWIVEGERCTEVNLAVIDHCKQIAQYFKTVTTKFNMNNVIKGKHRIAINGNAEFIHEGKSIQFVSACDVYEFNDFDELQTITLYCIADK
jgi:hypothetical protein